MIKTLSYFLFAFLLFFSISLLNTQPSLGAKDLEEVLNEIEKANQRFTSLEAEITYTRSIFLLEEEEVSHGKMFYKKPKKMRMELKPPRDEIDIADGEYLWCYHPEVKQVEKYLLAKGETKELDFFQFGYEGSVKKAKENYLIEMISQDDGDDIYILKLIPKEMDPPPQYSEIRLWVEEGHWLPTRIELYESEGEVINRIELWDMKLNKPLKDSLFQFTPPEGVEVIESF